MKKLFTLLLLIQFISINAQITYTESDGPRPGLTISNRQIADIGVVDLNALTEPGANQTWDVRGNYVDGVDQQYRSVADLHFKNLFPGANIAFVEKDDVDSSYTMMEKNSTGLYIIGSWSPSAAIVFQPKLLLIPFPLTFGANFQNDATAEYTSNGFNFKIDYLKTNSTVEAWGSMRTEENTYPVLKIKSKQISELSVNGFPFGSTTVETHTWVTNNFAAPLVELTANETEIDTFLLTDTSLVNNYQQIFVSNNNLLKSNHSISITPNPVNDIVTVKVKNLNFNSGSYSLINAEGKTIMEGDLNANQELQLNLAHLSSGNYLIQLLLDKQTSIFDIITKK